MEDDAMLVEEKSFVKDDEFIEREELRICAYPALLFPTLSRLDPSIYFPLSFKFGAVLVFSCSFMSVFCELMDVTGYANSLYLYVL